MNLPEIAGDAAILVDPTKPDEIVAAIDVILKDEKFRDSLCEKGIERAAQFSWKHMAEKYLELYKELLNK